MVITNGHSKKFHLVLPAILLATVTLSAVLGAVVLELFAIRVEGGGSLTTMFPGFVYANAMILKISLLEVACLFILGIAIYFIGRTGDQETWMLPGAAIVSILLPAAAPLVGAIAIVVTQSKWDVPIRYSIDYFSRVSQVGVFVLVGALTVSVLTGVYSLIRHERPRSISLVSIATAITYLLLVRYWEFYKLGFDQDLWNNI